MSNPLRVFAEIDPTTHRLGCLLAAAALVALAATSLQAVPDPSAVYCEEMGYQLDGEACVFPDQSRCPTWDFYRGECGQRFSYCGRVGGSVGNRRENMGSWTASYAVCSFRDGSECGEDALRQGSCAIGDCRRWSLRDGCERPKPVGPQVRVVPRPDVPAGLKATCLKGPDTLEGSRDCPVLEWRGKVYWALSHVDNREAMTLVAYDETGAIVEQRSLPGARYVWRIDVDAEAETVTLRGQADKTIVLGWDELRRSPGPPAPGPRVTTLHDGDHGATVELAVGEMLEVVLESNPTTGYRWRMAGIDDPVVLETAGKDYRADPVPEGWAGGGGREVFRFRAAGPGTTGLRLMYGRPRTNQAQAVRVFSVRVVVE